MFTDINNKILPNSIHILKKKLELITKSAFTRNVAVISSGAVFSHILTFGSSPILSRLFTPESFGLLGLFTATAGLIGSCANLRYELPIVIEKNNFAGASLVHLCTMISTIVAIISILIISMLGNKIASLLGTDKVINYLYLITPYIFATGIFLTMSQWACRRKEFKLLSINPIIRSIVTIIIQLVAGALKLSEGWLIIGFVSGQITASVAISWRLVVRDWKYLKPRRWPWQRMAIMAKKYRRFLHYSAPQELINALSQQLPNFILGFFFGPSTVGLYWLTVRVLQAPSALIGQPVRQVFYQRVCECINQNRSPLHLIINATICLLAIGCICFLPIIIFGPTIFTLVFSELWSESGEYARWVSLWSLTMFINIPAVCAMQALGLQKELLIYEILLFVGRNGALVLYSSFGKPLHSIAAYALTGMFFNICLIIFAIRKVYKEDNI